jgi:hypothetical protein
MTEGQYLYCVERDILGPELRIRRAVLLKWDPKADRFEIGDSKDPSSRFESSFVSRGLGGWHESPIEAVNSYIAAESERLKNAILSHEAEIQLCNAKLKSLKKLDHSKLKTRKYADDWVPCDF